MKLGISAKLFLVLLMLSIAVSVAMGISARFSFTQGFLGYLNEQGMLRVEYNTRELARAYERNGSWQFLRDNPRSWFEILRPGQQTGPGPDISGVHLRITLLDTEKQYVVGFRGGNASMPMRPILAHGNTVGWLVMTPFEETTADADVHFQERQLRSNWILGVSVVVLAGLITFLLSRALVTPLKRLATATQRLAGGDYSMRVATQSPASPPNSGFSNDEIGHLSRDFNRLAEILERNEALRRRFMADISHELRTPLSVLRGELEAIEDGVRELTPQSLHSLQAEVGTLSKLVSDLYDLSLSDVGALTYRMTAVDLGSLLSTTIEAFSSRFDSLNLKVDAQIESVHAQGDAVRLQQLFNNLLENMARYTQSPGSLRIVCKAQDDIELEFHNSGPGIAAAELDQVFDRFFRAEPSRSRATGGAGLGLAICRNIVEAHGGRISAQVSPLGGMLIVVRMPASHEGHT